MRLENPDALWLLLLLPVLWFVRRRPSAIPFPGLFDFQPSELGWKQRAALCLPLFRILSLASLVIAMAVPQIKPVRARDVTRGVAIQLVVDRSASMATVDMGYQGAMQSRLDAVKRISRDFILGHGRGLPGRPNDSVGLISFAGEPATLSPLTLSHQTLLPWIDQLRVAESWEEDGTAIGDALALAAARLRASSEEKKITGRLIVLITDGENNMGERTPEQSAEIAKQWGVKIHAIVIRPEGRSRAVQDAMARWTGITGGVARTADDSSALEAIYQEIDRLEPSDLESVKWNDGDLGLMLALIAAAMLIGLEFVLRETWLRKAPA